MVFVVFASLPERERRFSANPPCPWLDFTLSSALYWVLLLFLQDQQQILLYTASLDADDLCHVDTLPPLGRPSQPCPCPWSITLMAPL